MMIRKQHIINIWWLAASLLLAIVSPKNCFAQQTWSLQQCIDYAIEHNIYLQQQNLSIGQQDLIVNTAKNKWAPRISLDIDEVLYPHYPITGGTVTSENATTNSGLLYFLPSLNLSMPIYYGGNIRSRHEYEKFNLTVATENLAKARNDIRIQVATSYLQVLYYQGLVDVAKKQVEVSKQLLFRAEALVKEGKRPESELAEAKAKLANDEYYLSYNQGFVTTSSVNLAQLLNLEYTDDFIVGDSTLTCDIINADTILTSKEIYDSIVENYPSILAAKAACEASKQNIRMQKSLLYPQISLNASLSSSHSYFFEENIRSMYKDFGGQMWDMFNPYIGVSLKYNIYSGREVRNNIKIADLKLESSQLSIDDARYALRNELEQAYYNATSSASNYNAAVNSENASRISFEYTQKSYDAGRSTFFDLTQANQTWIDSQRNVVQAKYDYLIRIQILDFYINR